ncbi:BTAD domain-containing putative transcriptional regulator [Lentzea sp. NPDC005914]|uniref:AfsR/SARP family transcriptional regulator n=1 Tax=Lentzea sp. NPDC005914 TaxID=3154572 RepID=UPI0033D97344
MTNVAEFRLLGPVEVLVHGQPQPLGGPRQRAVVAAMLLHANQEVRTNQLLKLVWSDAPSSAASNLRTYLTRLRRTLSVPGEPESRLRTLRGGGHVLTVRPGELDLATFSEHAALGEQAGDESVARTHLSRALNVWRGRALDDIALGPALEAEATRLEAQRDRVHERLLRARFALGEYDELIPELRALLRQNPLWESLVSMLMLSLHRTGRRAEALELFRRTRHQLVEELGVEPGADLRALHRQLLADADDAEEQPDPAPAAPAPVRDRPAQLPADLPAFTGRTPELARLADPQNSAHTTVISAIDGMAGVGKSTLAVHAAHQLAPWYSDGQLFIDLHGHTTGVSPLDPGEALDRFLRSLGVLAQDIPNNTEARAALYRSQLANRRVLVVLDNAQSEAQVRPLLPGTDSCRTLITSRRQLSGLEHVQPLTLDVLPLPDAIALLTTICTPERLAGEPPELVEEVVELCGRLPLAIRIAGMRLRARPAWPLAHLRDRLSDQQRQVAELQTTEHSVEAAFNLSYSDLDPPQRRMVELLGRHPGVDIDSHAAAALAGWTVAEADDVLEELCGAHLVRQPTPGRYDMHNLVHAYAANLVSEVDTAAIRRLLDYYLHTADAADRSIHPPRPLRPIVARDPGIVVPSFADSQQALAWCDTVFQNVAHLTREAKARGLLAHAWQLPWRLAGYMFVRNRWAEGIQLYLIALDATTELGDRYGESEILVGLAFAHSQLKHHGESVAYYIEAIVASREVGNKWTEGFSTMGLADEYRRLGQFGNAIESHLHALEVYREIDDVFGQCITLAHLGDTYRDLGKLEAAADCYRRAAEDSVHIGNQYGIGQALNGLGAVERLLGRTDDAAATATRAIAVCREIGDRHGEAQALVTLGLATADADLLRTALAIMIDLDDPRAEEVGAHLATLTSPA